MAFKYIYKTPEEFSNIILKSDGKYLTGLWFEGSRDSSKNTTDCEDKDLEIFRKTGRWLDIYFSGKIPDFTPEYRLENVTPFRQETVDIMNCIEHGKTMTYNDISKVIAEKRGISRMSAQAVGGAVGWNPICIIIPCHRVVGAGGNLTGYGGGLKNKVELLKLEGVDMTEFFLPCILNKTEQYKNILKVSSRKEFREWLILNCAKEQECYVVLKRGKPVDEEHFWYLDAIEEALCFGWVDSTVRVIDGISMQRFSPRRKGGNWTELNKERVRRLEKLGLMTDAGRAVLPPMEVEDFCIDEETVSDLKKARVWSKFKTLPPLYQRVRASNLKFYRDRHPESYRRMLNHTIETVKEGKTFGEWNDYGRLLEK